MIKKQKATKNEPIKPLVNEPIQAKGKSSIMLYVILLLVIVVTAAVLMVMNQFKHKPQVQNSKEAEKREVVDKAVPMGKNDILALISRVSSLILIKGQEEPTVATVQDADSLRKSNPSFYKDVENGDRLLVWSDKAVLYSTKMDKLLSVMPIFGNTANTLNVTATSTPQTASTTVAVATSTVQTENAVVDVRNGTTVGGRAKLVANLVKAQNIKTGLIGDAINKDYDATVIYNLSDKPLTATLKALVDATKGQVKAISDTEKSAYKGMGDIVIVVGKDFTP
jgi:hypothetical protein